MRISTSIGLLLRPRQAPDFANGLFLTAANLGTALGSAVCGMVIAHMGNAVYDVGRHRISYFNVRQSNCYPQGI